MTLPESVQEIADVIGREAALYLIGQLPTCYAGVDGKKSWGAEGSTSKRSNRVILYVPRRLRPDHPLVGILGWATAQKLVQGFGGEILQPANCREVYTRFRNAEVRRLANDNYSSAELAAIMGMTDRAIRTIKAAANDNAENPQED